MYILVQKNMIKITHNSRFDIFKNNVFDNVNSYDDMIKEIYKYGENLKLSGNENYANNGWGMPFEIYTQFFMLKFGSETFIQMLNIVDTSSNPYQEGYDFTFNRKDKTLGIIQSKFSNNISTSYNGKTATFTEQSDIYSILPENRIWFISIDDHDKLFYGDKAQIRKRLKIFDRTLQEEWILREPSFWDDLRDCLRISCKNNYRIPYEPRECQNWILNGHIKHNKKYFGTKSVLDLTYNKGRVSAATGAGKSLCIFYNINDIFTKYDEKICTVVYPTRSLIDQGFKEYYECGLFYNTNISCLIIRSGDMPNDYNSNDINLKQSTKINEIKTFINETINNGKKLLIMITMDSQELKYKSIIQCIKEQNLEIGLEIVDEYHLIVKSKETLKSVEETKNYLTTTQNRSKRTIYYSASNKTGKIISTDNEKLFGPLLAKVTVKDLQERGIVTPHLSVILIKQKSNIRFLSNVKRNAKYDKIDLNKANKEASGIIVAHKDLTSKIGHNNLMTFTHSVSASKLISEDNSYYDFLNNVNNYHICGSTSNRERSEIFNIIRNSKNNILHQHSVAGVGIDIQNLHGIILNRDLVVNSLQQAIGRTIRCNSEDTKNFENGIIKTNNSTNWIKYCSYIYILINDEDDEENSKFVKKIVNYLYESEIPKNEWDIQTIEPIEDGFNNNSLDFPFSKKYEHTTLNKSDLEKMINKAIIEYDEIMEEFKLDEKIKNMSLEEKINRFKFLKYES
jgi:superfamily II DNA or RNA helicase